MAKNKSTLLNMILTLFLVTFIASTALGIIHKITKDPIAEAKKAKMNTSLKRVLPEFDNNPFDETMKITVEQNTFEIFTAKQKDKVVGYAIKTSTNKGFGGTIKLMVGFLKDGIINNIVVLEHNETPGLGDKIEKEKSEFGKQFSGKDPDKFQLEVKKDGGDIDGITGSTVSSRAYCDAVRKAYMAFKKIKDNE